MTHRLPCGRLKRRAVDPRPVKSSEALAAASASAMSFLENFHKKRKGKIEKEKQAFERVSEGLIDNDLTDDHLDLNLAQEEQFLMEYLSLLN
ncbi:hypothetical protein J6590_052017 [Homalodisca vitripennis]|nr:hypothetical protein J6590_052017 [Homalodisca vitripennis]